MKYIYRKPTKLECLNCKRCPSPCLTGKPDINGKIKKDHTECDIDLKIRDAYGFPILE